jgi:hypothetical protein
VSIEGPKLLTKSLYPTSSSNENELVRQIKEKSKSISIISAPDLSLITRLRMFSCSSINNGDSISKDNWINALIFLQENLSKITGSLGLICKLNGILLHGANSKPSSYRTTPMLAGVKAFPCSLDINNLMNDYIQRLFTIKDPVSQAAYTYQTLISVHPFIDGNGRTARLVADAILMNNNYLPLAFPSTALGLVIHTSKDKEKSPHTLALEKLLLSASWLSEVLREK